jgi:CRP/FNR family transcriptional regulator, cyclic AMP receptor protein
MRAPYGLNILDNCLTCPVREEHLFCNLTAPAVRILNEIKSTAVYPKSAMLFIEGQQPRGVFVLCTGKVKLSTSSTEGKTIITKISEAGDVLGLNATISNRPYEVTAEMIEPGQANFIARDAFLQFLRDYGEVAVRVAEQLSRNYYTAYEEIRTLGLASSPSERFAKLLLGWSNAAGNGDPSQVKLTLTHEEIGEMIGATRETVTRLFSEFKKRQLLQLKGASLIIRNKGALEKMVHS